MLSCITALVIKLYMYKELATEGFGRGLNRRRQQHSG